MTEPTELLPCPFCGGINIIHCGHHMYCHACGADGPDADSQHESEAIAAWNRRTPQLVNLGFTIENRAGIYVLVWEAGGCQPATSAEVAMWKALEYHRAQTRPIEQTDEAITAARSRLGEKT